ncbi:MAG: exopolysaccharide biosynthesis polyprenyl glycosylphosphotransferase [Verrucomicrobia bacterium]|nr:exopolysaccharide biosynthesis polyprenyl glycosylphosphotransferase [Verrucomicrobiota bacterium]
MISQRIRGLNTLFVLAQLTLVLLVYWLHFLIVETVVTPAANLKNYELYCIVIYVALLIESVRRLNRQANFLQKSRIINHRTALQQTGFVAAIVIIFLVATKDAVMSRTFLFSFLPVLYMTLFLTSQYLPNALAQVTFRGIRQERTLLIGSAMKIEALSRWLDRKATLGIQTIGFLSDEEGVEQVKGLRWLGGMEDLEYVVREHDVTQVILVELPMFPHVLQSVTNICELLGVRLIVHSDLDSKFRHPITWFEDDGLLFIGLREEPLENPFNRFLKRVADVAVATPVILFVLPFTSVVVWLCQRAQSPGPLFILQPRAGFQNRSFNILKYRTMHVNIEAARQATKGDPRIYPAGRYLRKFSLDELPQFWNVLKGDMSVVGPRPHLQEHNQEFAAIMSNYHIRAFVKPGITGLAQVRGYRGEATSADVLIKRIQFDIYYLENWSISVDLAIMLQTGWHMAFPPKTAY